MSHDGIFGLATCSYNLADKYGSIRRICSNSNRDERPKIERIEVKTEVSNEVLQNLIHLERMKCFEEWLLEWGLSVRECLNESSDMFKPCIAQLDKIMDGIK